jgi:archaellin
MRTQVLMVIAMLALYAPIAAAQSTTSTPSTSTAPAPSAPQKGAATSEDDEGEVRAFPATLAGAWKSATDRLALTSEFDESVWGKNAAAVRDVELTIRPDGGAALTITRKVVDAKGRAIAGSTSIERADLTIRDGRPGVASRVEYATTVAKAERRYPDSPDEPWAIDGLKVVVSTLDDTGAAGLEIRVDTPEGRGSFWETLRRTGAANRRAGR